MRPGASGYAALLACGAAWGLTTPLIKTATQAGHGALGIALWQGALNVALLGAVLVCVADMAVRSLPGLQELKLGVLTSLLGAPVFIWLVWRERVRW